MCMLNFFWHGNFFVDFVCGWTRCCFSLLIYELVIGSVMLLGQSLWRLHKVVLTTSLTSSNILVQMMFGCALAGVRGAFLAGTSHSKGWSFRTLCGIALRRKKQKKKRYVDGETRSFSSLNSSNFTIQLKLNRISQDENNFSCRGN